VPPNAVWQTLRRDEKVSYYAVFILFELFIDVVGAARSTLSKFVGLRNVYCICDCIVWVNCVLLDRLY
jgi:hypothetical protein